jgi:hypothetical protein
MVEVEMVTNRVEEKNLIVKRVDDLNKSIILHESIIIMVLFGVISYLVISILW